MAGSFNTVTKSQSFHSLIVWCLWEVGKMEDSVSLWTRAEPEASVGERDGEEAAPSPGGWMA
jgi:hypothetical protein